MKVNGFRLQKRGQLTADRPREAILLASWYWGSGEGRHLSEASWGMPQGKQSVGKADSLWVKRSSGRDHSFTVWLKVDLVGRYRKPGTEFGREGWIMAGAEVGVKLPCILA